MGHIPTDSRDVGGKKRKQNIILVVVGKGVCTTDTAERKQTRQKTLQMRRKGKGPFPSKSAKKNVGPGKGMKSKPIEGFQSWKPPYLVVL